MGYKLKKATIWRENKWQPGANTIAYFPLKTDAVDVANNITLTSYGTTNYTTVGGVQSAEFTKSNWLYNSNVATIPQGDVAKTWNFWMYIKGSNTNRVGLTQIGGGTTGGDVFGTGVYRGDTNIVMTRNYSTSSTYTPTLNTWTNIAVTYYNSFWKMYVNGILQVTWGNTTAPTDGHKLYLGQNVGSTNTGDCYYGNLSNVILENKERTAQEVLDYYNQTKGDYGYTPGETMKELQLRPSGWKPGANTVGYWTFDDQNANQITDVSGNGNNITGSIMPTYTQVLGSNYAGNYNNVSSGETPGYRGTIDSNKFTVMLWLKVLATGQQYMVNMIGNSGNSPALIYGYNSGQIELYSYQSNNTYRSTIKSSTALDTWYCVGFTRNGTTLKTYLNGAYVASVTIPVVTVLNDFRIGSAGSVNRFHGLIGEAVLKSGVEEDLSYMSNYYDQTKSNYGIS